MQVLDRQPETPEADVSDLLFIVWFNVNAFLAADKIIPPDWWWEEPGPQSLIDALDLSAKLRQDGWQTIIVPANQNPRPDGRWDNPV